MTDEEFMAHRAKLASHVWSEGGTERFGEYGNRTRRTTYTCQCGAKAEDKTVQRNHSAFVNSFDFVDHTGAQMCPVKPIPRNLLDIQASYDDGN